MRLCSVEGCGKKHYGNGYCNIHWQRWKRHGDASIAKYYYTPPELKLAKKKRCSVCKEVKHYSKFAKNNHNTDKCQDYCTKCRKVMRTIIKNKYNGLYQVWVGIKERCFSPSSKSYKHYGGRGITMCQKWRDSFQVFYSWAKGKHRKGLTIDRRDNNGNYEPKNCRFVTNLENVRNSSTTKLNVTKVKQIKKLLEEKAVSVAKIAKKFAISESTIYSIKLNKTWKDIAIINTRGEK